MDGYLITGLIGSVAALFLSVRALRSHGMSFENKAWMAAVWAVVLIVMAFAFTRLGY